MRRLTVLLFRDEWPGEDENIGCVGNYGSEWQHAPEMFERFNVVDEATHERLVDALRSAEMALRWYKESDQVAQARKIDELLSALEAEKGGEL